MTSGLARAPLAAAALVLALSLAGCGDGEPATPTAQDSPTPSVSETAAPTEAPPSSSGIGGGPAATDTATATPTPSDTPAPSETSVPTPSPSQSPSESAPVNGPPRTYDEALASFDEAAGSQEFSRFASPTGNLYCVLDSPYLPPSCELGTGAIPDPASCPADGPSQNVGRIEFTDAGPQPVCNSDTIREPGPPTLGYGGVATWPGTSVTCLMEKYGVTCIDPQTGQGYVLAKGRYQIF